MRNIALRIRYDGSAYHGWQRQKDLPTVQQTLEEALEKICGHSVTAVGCGRTDAGVHAERYCANFRTDCAIPIDRVPLAVNTRLPGDIAVMDACEAEEGFNAIGSCLRKEYVYRILNRRIPDPFLDKRVCFYPSPLDIGQMKRAALAFEGTHDFAAVRSVGTETKTTVRTVYWCRAERKDDIITVAVCADGGRHHGLCQLRQASPPGYPLAAGDPGPAAHRTDHAAPGSLHAPGLVRGSRGRDDGQGRRKRYPLLFW